MKGITFAFLGVALTGTAVNAQEAAQPRDQYRVAKIGYSGSVSSDGRFLTYVDEYAVRGRVEDHIFVLDRRTGERR